MSILSIKMPDSIHGLIAQLADPDPGSSSLRRLEHRIDGRKYQRCRSRPIEHARK